jgi:hypothetical protein
VPTPRRISDIKPLITNLAQTSHYEVVFGGLPAALRQHLSVRGIDNNFIGESVGLLCNSASLPATSFGTADIAGNYMGVVEKMAHTRIFTQIDLEFYVDSSYKTLKFLEHWMEFISFGSGVSPAQDGYFFRMRYPREYKTDTTKIIKFDRDYNNQIEYTFFGMFPIAMNSVPISYENSNILKVSASFNYDRYICGKATSYSVYAGISNNLVSSKQREKTQQEDTNANKPGQQRLVPRSAGSLPSGGVGFVDPSKTLYENLYGSRREFRAL